MKTKEGICGMGVQERKQRERERRREQIRKAALSLISENGFQAASISRIAKRAELGVGTIYFYYPSKEEIFADIQAQGLTLLSRKVARACEGAGRPDDALGRIGIVYLTFSRENKSYFDLINYFLSSPNIVLPQALKSRVDFTGKTSLDQVAAIIEQGIKAKIFRKVDPENHALMFWSMIHGIIQMRKMQPTLFDAKTHEELYSYGVDQFIAGIRLSDG